MVTSVFLWTFHDRESNLFLAEGLWTRLNNECISVNTIPQTYAEAWLDCENQNARLLSAADEEDANNIVEYLQSVSDTSMLNVLGWQIWIANKPVINGTLENDGNDQIAFNTFQDPQETVSVCGRFDYTGSTVYTPSDCLELHGYVCRKKCEDFPAGKMRFNSKYLFLIHLKDTSGCHVTIGMLLVMLSNHNFIIMGDAALTRATSGLTG